MKKTWSRMKTKNRENSLLGPKTCSSQKYFKNYSNVFSPTKNSDRKKKQPFHLSSIQGKDSPRLKSRSSSAQCPLRALRSLSFLSSFLPVRRARRIARNTVTTRVHLQNEVSLVELPTPPWNSLQRPSKSIAQLGRAPARLNSIS